MTNRAGHTTLSIAMILAGVALLLPFKVSPTLAVNDAMAITCYTNSGQRCCWLEYYNGRWWEMCMENSSEDPPEPEG